MNTEISLLPISHLIPHVEISINKFPAQYSVTKIEIFDAIHDDSMVSGSRVYAVAGLRAILFHAALSLAAKLG
jgi:hypothetical protein